MAGTTPGLLRDSRPEHQIPAGGRPSNNLNPGRPSGDATKRSCLYD